MKKISAVVLAAGEGKRMKSSLSKVVHKAAGKAMVDWVCTSVKEAGVEDIIIVIGHKAEQVRECLGEEYTYAAQEQQLGTGHAVMQAVPFLEGGDGITFVLCGDTPVITADTLKKAMEYHEKAGNGATVITAEMADPTGYGRIVKNPAGDVERIVEHKDASEEQRAIREINSGMYCFNTADLITALKEIKNNNAQGEYYLTDTLEILIKKGRKVGAFKIEDSREIMGVNDRVQLAEAASILKSRILNRVMLSGVTILDPATTTIDNDVVIGMDTVIYPGTILEGRTEIGSGCKIGPYTRIVDSKIDDSVEITNSVIMDSEVGAETRIGPFAYLRPESKLGKKVKIGDFVEIKKSTIGDKTSVAHLSYIGDSEFGKNINVGCGVVVVNYDGKKKHKTIVGDDSFIGCNVNLVSPVEVKPNAYIAAGSTITDEVPENSLAIARCRQTVKEDWVIKKGISRRKE